MIFHEQLYLRTKSSDNSVFNGKKITLLKFFLKKMLSAQSWCTNRVWELCISMLHVRPSFLWGVEGVAGLY